MTPLRTSTIFSSSFFFFNGSSKQNNHDSYAPFVSRTVFFFSMRATVLLCSAAGSFSCCIFPRQRRPRRVYSSLCQFLAGGASTERDADDPGLLRPLSAVIRPPELFSPLASAFCMGGGEVTQWKAVIFFSFWHLMMRCQRDTVHLPSRPTPVRPT